GVVLEPNDFAPHLAARLSPDADPTTALARVKSTDLYLALACARGDAAAIAHLESAFFRTIARRIARVVARPEEVDEVLQSLRVKLLVGAGGEPKILEYAGRGDLLAWLEVAATRLAIDRVRSPARELAVTESRIEAIAAPRMAPELELVRERYQEE